MSWALRAQAYGLPSALDHPTEPSGVERGSAFRDKDEGASAALSLMLAQGPEFPPCEPMRGWRPILDPANVRSSPPAQGPATVSMSGASSLPSSVALA